MTSRLELFAARAPGVYRLCTRLTPSALRRDLEPHGWKVFVLEGREIKTKAAFLDRAALALDFPAWSGRNWDAFEDSINDLSWAPAKGYVLLFERVDVFARAQPQEWQTARAILAECVSRWQQAGVPFFVLLRGARAAALDAPEF